MDPTAIEAYIAKLPYNEPFTSLDADFKSKLIFGSSEMLRRRYGAANITDEMVALQALYTAEGEAEEFAKFKRHGVKSMGLDGMSFSFEGANVSPEVVALIEAAAAGGDSSTGGAIIGMFF